MVNLAEIRTSLEAQVNAAGPLPCHVGAFCAWLLLDHGQLQRHLVDAARVETPGRHPEFIAALGYGAAAGLLTDEQRGLLAADLAHLAGRSFFAHGRPLRFEVDGVALLGVALALKHNTVDALWMHKLLERSIVEMSGDAWQLGLANAAAYSLGAPIGTPLPPELAVALASNGSVICTDDDVRRAWGIIKSFELHHDGPTRDAARLSAFRHACALDAQINPSSITRDGLIALLSGIRRSMRRWTYEDQPRTSKSREARWEVENEYHVQNLLWSVLAPIFPDLEDEENLLSVGHKNPRADLGVPSLGTIIEVKFLRSAGQAAYASLIEEIAADAGLYLSKPSPYDAIVAFVWDDAAHTEQHDELQSGLVAIRGVAGAVVVPRPAKMRRRMA
ncbi:hypothetical protein [Hyphomicrobium sp. 99]|uniref:PD-(D/E)XK nuclease domain-containing protein n=1 Tax=Hyphomicrobium sp. 99 TaxID=1163419 RepID=UPI000699236F|nr:hypothetical protein [Hyphomicrobium sp. 99]